MEVGVGRDGCPVGCAIGSVKESRFLDDAEDVDRDGRALSVDWRGSDPFKEERLGSGLLQSSILAGVPAERTWAMEEPSCWGSGVVAVAAGIILWGGVQGRC